MTEDEHPNERLVTPSEDGEGFDRSLVSRRSMLGGSALLAGLLAYTSDPTDPQLPGRASGSAAGIARASDNPDEPLIILGPESDPVGYLFQDTAGGIILQDATSGNHFWYNESQGRWETDAELDVPSLTTDQLNNDEEPNLDISELWAPVFSAGFPTILERFTTTDGLRQVTSGSGSVSLTYDGVDLSTGATDASHVLLLEEQEAYIRDNTWDKDRRFAAAVKVGASQGKQFAGTGAVGEDDFLTRHIGFKWTGGNLVASVADGTTENTTTLDSSPTTGSLVSLYMEFLSGDRAKFWVDKDPLSNSPDAELTSNLPTGVNNSDKLWFLHAENDSTTDRTLTATEIRVAQQP